MSEENQVVIEEEPVAEEKIITEADLEGLSEDELKMAKEQEVVPEQPKEEVEEVQEESEEGTPEEVKSEVDLNDFDTFEKVHDAYQSNPELFYKLPKNIKNMYHNSKGLYKKAKEEEEKRKELESKTGFEKVQEAGAKAVLDKIKSRLGNPDNLTVEELQGLLGEIEKSEVETPITKKDLEEIERKKFEEAERGKEAQKNLNQKILRAEAYAKTNLKDLTDGKYEDLQAVTNLAQEVAEKKPRYLKAINEAFLDDDMSEADVVDLVIDIARLNPDWGKSGENNGKTVEKIVANAGKQKTSASLNGGKGGRVVTHDDLTPEDALKLTQKQWDALPKKVRDRLLSQI